MEKKIERIILVRLNSALINEAKHPRSLRPPFTLKYIQALLLKKRYQVKLIDCAIEKITLDKLANVVFEWRPELVIVSESVLEHELAAQFISELKKQGWDIPIIIVGQGVSEQILDGPSYSGADFALKGEAEIEIINLMNKIEEGVSIDVLKAHYKKQLLNSPIIVEKIDELPFPIYEPGELDKYGFVYPLRIYKRIKWGHILSSRGCPYDCIFCSQTIRESYGKDIRLRSAQNVVDEIEVLISRGANIIAFDDDNFTTVEGHVISICQEITRRKLNISWICHARVDNLSKDLLVSMKQAGCILLRCGIESGSERILKILKKGDSSCWKQKAIEVFKEAKGLNIMTNALFLIGNPTETRQEIEESIALAKELAPDIIQVAFFTPYLSSAVYDEYKDKLIQAPLSQMYHYKPVMVNFSCVGQRELTVFQRKFYRSILLDPYFIYRHIRNHGIFYLHNYKVLSKLLKGAINIGNQ